MFSPRGSSGVLGPDVCGTGDVDVAASRWLGATPLETASCRACVMGWFTAEIVAIVIAAALTTGCGGDTTYWLWWWPLSVSLNLLRMSSSIWPKIPWLIHFERSRQSGSLNGSPVPHNQSDAHFTIRFSLVLVSNVFRTRGFCSNFARIPGWHRFPATCSHLLSL